MRSLAVELSDFMEPCRQTVVLMESSHESCSDEEAGGQQGLQAWVDTVNGECCLQHGIDVCREGSEVPWTCNAVCATVFIPFAEQFAEQCLGCGPDGPPPPLGTTAPPWGSVSLSTMCVQTHRAAANIVESSASASPGRGAIAGGGVLGTRARRCLRTS